MRHIILVAHNLRSTHNVGSLLRTADGLGIAEVLLTGYTPYPLMENDSRLPHLSTKIGSAISKTALGAERSVRWRHIEDIDACIQELHADGWQLVAVEQAPGSIHLPKFNPPDKVVLVVGREVEGIEAEVLQQMDFVLEIPMFGTKESFNVVQAAAMAMYHCQFYPFS